MVITKTFRFESSHTLPKHKAPDGSPGKCSRLHGHSYVLDLSVEGPVDPDSSLVMDFADLSRLYEEHIHARLDHRHINEVFIALAWPGDPSAENIARFIWHSLRDKLPQHVKLYRVKLWETYNSYVELMPWDEAGLLAQIAPPPVQMGPKY